jgi:hypothetical protein
MSCAEGVLGHVEPVNIHYSCLETCKNPRNSSPLRNRAQTSNWQGERFFRERLGWVTRKCEASQLCFEISKIIDNVVVY